MPDLTDSYCERCGARHVVSPTAPTALSLRRARVLARGLKNFVLTDGQSLHNSLVLARNEDDHDDVTRATESFHRIFNFCMTCRQYACDRCWNANAGACLSCAPETGIEPVAPEDHLIVRTPVARWDTDWSQFPDGPAVEPVVRPAPPAWPTVDLPVAVPAQTPGNGRSHHSSLRPADPQSWNLWPIADQIAPEMTLTPEELELVESRLGQGDSTPDPAPKRGAVSEPEAFDAMQPWTPQRDAAADAARAVEAPPGAAAQMDAADSAGAPDAAPEQAPVGASSDLEPNSEPLEPLPETPLAPQRLLRKSATVQHLPQPLPAEPAHRTGTHELPAAVARLLGRHSPESPDRPATESRSSRAHDGQLPRDPWPRPTQWLDRSSEARPWELEAATVADAAPETVAASQASAPAAASAPEPDPILARDPAPDSLPAAVEPAIAFQTQAAALDSLRTPSEPEANDARWAAAVRLSAVSASDFETIGEPEAGLDFSAGWVGEPNEPAPAPAVAKEPLLDSPAAQAAEQRSEPSVSRSTPAAPWPPLGSRWPSREDPGAVWPGPDAAPVPAALTARQAAVPPLDELWALSAQEVLNRGSVRVCHRCALPVSTQARFCRRCGTQQA